MPKVKVRQSPAIGRQFKRSYKKRIYTLEVVNHEGRVAYKVGGSVYFSPTAAAVSITRNSVNGWKFWGID